MSWRIEAPLSDSTIFGRLLPERVLNEFDGPKIFTTRDIKNNLFLAFWCDEDEDSGMARFIVAPTNEKIVCQVDSGDRQVRSAILPPQVWVADVDLNGDVESVWQLSSTEIPEDYLPRKGIFLKIEHQPLLTLRFAGSELSKDNVPASVVKRAVDSVTTVMKSLVEATSQRIPLPGRPDDAFRMLYDLRTQDFALASFQVSFKSPILDNTGQSTYEQVALLLNQTLEWLVGPKTEYDVEVDSELRLAALASVVNLTPPKHGLIEEVHLCGTLTSGISFTLNRTHTLKAKKELGRIKSDDPIVSIKGQVRQLDKDRCILTVRDQAVGLDQKCRYDDQYADDAIEALANDDYVHVAGRRLASGVVEINLLSILKPPFPNP